MGIRGTKAIWDADTDGIELLDITIGDLLDRQARAFPDREAIVYRYPEIGLNLRLTYRQYQAEADRLAKGLLGLGIERGEHVAVWATNVPEWPLLEMALAKVGAVMVTVNTNYRSAELEYVLRQGDVSTLFLVPSYHDNSFVDAVYSAVPELYRRRVEAGFGLRIDNQDGYDYFSPSGFRDALQHAVDVSDGYVWIYGQIPRFFPKSDITDEYIQAISQVRASVGNHTQSR